MRAPVVVAHAGPFACERGDVEDIVRRVLAHARTLAPVAREHGVRVALENVMPGPATEIATRALADLDPEVFGFCYDSSHDQIDGPRSFDLVDAFRGRILAVHLSDRVRPHVDHLVPGEGWLDWDGLAEALGAARYGGPVLMEVMMEHSRHREPGAFLRAAHSAALRLRDRLDAPSV
jgi:sugar phosphate isomerase/epimerase